MKSSKVIINSRITIPILNHTHSSPHQTSVSSVVSFKLSHCHNYYSVTLCWYKILDQKINHLLNIDYLKLFAKSDKRLQDLLDIVKELSSDIGMEFGFYKYAIVIFQAGIFIKAENIELDRTAILNLDHSELYKYMNIWEPMYVTVTSTH